MRSNASLLSHALNSIPQTTDINKAGGCTDLHLMNWSRERFCTCSDLDVSWQSTSLLFLLLISFPLFTWGQMRADHRQHSHPAHPSHSCAEGRRGNLPLGSQTHPPHRWSLRCSAPCQQILPSGREHPCRCLHCRAKRRIWGKTGQGLPK